MSFLLPLTSGVLASATTYHVFRSLIESDTQVLQARMLQMRKSLEATLPADQQDQSLFVASPQQQISQRYASSYDAADTFTVLGFPVRVPGLRRKVDEMKGNWNRAVGTVAGQVAGDW
ncbi:hypothetical protein DFJ77DRAFT_346456 [Powellomyces hirtus]|nr:hypothetical protein DFJ77DRAFT_346456 [Powellomyces hirtus]